MTKALTQSMIEKRLAQKHGLPPAQVKRIVGDFTQEVRQGAKVHGRVRTALGLFLAKHKPAVKGGEKREVFGKMVVTKPKPANTVLKFRPSKETKQAIGGHMRPPATKARR